MWEQFVATDDAAINEFLFGLKNSRVKYFDLDPDHLRNILMRKPHAEGWIYKDKDFTCGMIMAFKEVENLHQLMHCYFTGNFGTDDAGYKFVAAKMDEYCARYKGGKWLVPMPKDCINEMSILNPTGFKASLAADKTAVVKEDGPIVQKIEFDAKP